MATCYSVARRCFINGAYNYQDLAQTALASILTEMRDHPHLCTGSMKWMSGQAKWAIADELRRENGRRGHTRQGKIRGARGVRMSLDSMTTEYNDPVSLAAPEQMEADLSDKLRDTTTLLRLGYTQAEIARMLGVTHSAIMLRVQSIKEQWNEALA